MEGRKICPISLPGGCTVHVREDRRRRQGKGPGFMEGVMETRLRRDGLMDRVITKIVEAVIGRRIMLHDLLGLADFALLYSGKANNRPLWRYRHVHGAPFRVSLLSHRLDFDNQYLTIVSEGYIQIIPGVKIAVLMELSVERIGVSPQGAAMCWAEKREPLILTFDLGPEAFGETAFSFDIGEGGTRSGLAGCGFLAFPDCHG